MSISGEEAMEAIEEESLIVAVKLPSVLYKVDEDDYRNVEKKCEAWKQIARDVGKPGKILIKRVYFAFKRLNILIILVEICKKLWGQLRQFYNRKKKEIKGKTGQARRKIENNPRFIQVQFLGDLPTCGR